MIRYTSILCVVESVIPFSFSRLFDRQPVRLRDGPWHEQFRRLHGLGTALILVGVACLLYGD